MTASAASVSALGVWQPSSSINNAYETSKQHHISGAQRINVAANNIAPA